jgi:lipopolysaccharide/colanic/teichoic acid biosynthesis glycosyltransferase
MELSAVKSSDVRATIANTEAEASAGSSFARESPVKDELGGLVLRSRVSSPRWQLVKRIIDVTLAISGGVVTFPLMFIIAAAVKLSSPGPVFYGQERIGRGGVPFRIWKFRTMHADAEEILEDFLETHPEFNQQWEEERKLNRDPRVVPGIGHFLRSCSLDELPQFWNVLKGEMSLVGPRPLPQYHLDQ